MNLIHFLNLFTGYIVRHIQSRSREPVEVYICLVAYSMADRSKDLYVRRNSIDLSTPTKILMTSYNAHRSTDNRWCRQQRLDRQLQSAHIDRTAFWPAASIIECSLYSWFFFYQSTVLFYWWVDQFLKFVYLSKYWIHRFWLWGIHTWIFSNDVVLCVRQTSCGDADGI